MERHVVKNLVVDSGAFIKRAALHNVGENFYTVGEVVQEIRDQATRDWLQTLPYIIKFREPLPEAVKIVTEFARKTGDLCSLSTTDIRVIALVYTLEKEFVGTDHVRMQPTNKVEWVMPKKCTHSSAMLPGFYVKKKTKKNKSTSSKPMSHTESETSTVTAVDELAGKMADVDVIDGCHGDTDTAGCHGNPSLPAGESADAASSRDSYQCPGETYLDTEDAEIPSTDDDSEQDDDDDYDDSEGWITPRNIEAMKQASIAMTQSQVTDLPVACVTTDYAMQNVLIQMGLRVVSVEGLLIRRTQSKILRCYGCAKVQADCEREFCSKCGNKTLSRVTVSYRDDGTVQYFLSRYKTFSARGLRYSLPTPQGGKYAVNPKLCEDQRQPQQRTSKKSKMKVDVFDPNYSALVSPFAANDVNSRSAALGYTGRRRGPGQRRRNPNENNKHYGHRK